MRDQNKGFKLKIKDVRCFAGEQYFNIRPLTFLIGRNSTGKTTVMSCFSVFYNFVVNEGEDVPDFNKEPYDMGSFTDIARKLKKKEGAKKQKTRFEIGIISDKPHIQYNFLFKEKDKGAEPVVSQVNITVEDFLFSLKKKRGKDDYIIKNQKNGKELKKNPLVGEGIRSFFELVSFPHFRFFKKQTVFSKKEREELLQAWDKLHFFGKKLFADRIFSMAPVRSKPQRTYNPIKESPSPEGVEIPVYLANLNNQKKIWKEIHKNLVNFGKASGLFSNIKVRKFGKTKGDPFQLQFQIEGTESNIIDTGYGLSQILPLLVRLFSFNIQRQKYTRSKKLWFLLQQPEVHLHPSAQAELASLFVKSVQANNSFLIETHSDYMLDRTRIEIRKGNINPDDVSFIYLESVAEGVKAHNMFIDKQGNLKGAPAGYRKFFIKETNRFLGFEK